ncbi:hypothetical protein SteCoe_318 [Stentor coeruleus]|uniref:PPM-type phosphatase domain-containing protein n=1 Tax=Stentor coeruleus TaxID=5963 RepID=A0A1R2D4K4_9CILI|nr:hypothetical protein SteCoe_318 [Stentor coeruleus]
MGTCFVCDSKIHENISYNEDVTLSIKERDRLGKVFRTDKVKFKLTMPIIHIYEEVNLFKLHLSVSACVLPGIDPRSMLNKECQDNLLCLNKDSLYLVGLFDGHGIDGLRVVEFVKDYMKSYFTKNTAGFISGPSESLTYMITECDKKLRSSTSGIDCSVSGTTAVVMIISDVIHVASVGDSRAILAMVGSVDPNFIPGKRYVEPNREIYPLRLTIDQRPNIKEELERIKKAGGKVQQLSNENGVKIGPYRVWKKTGTLPGLAMSRSIGDAIGKEIGVISTPMCNSFMFDKSTDLFLVIASDGIWDVMNCTEVINFIDKFRPLCKKNPEPVSFPVKAENTTVAHLIAEEARVRWMEICQDEDVMIDDISVVVVELKFLELFSEIPGGARQNVDVNTSVVSITDSGRLISSKGDPVRGSFVPAREVARRRIDPKRGSYVYENTKIDYESYPDLLDIPFSK